MTSYFNTNSYENNNQENSYTNNLSNKENTDSSNYLPVKDTFNALEKTQEKRKTFTAVPLSTPKTTKRMKISSPESADTVVLGESEGFGTPLKGSQSSDISDSSNNSTSTEEEFNSQGNLLIDQYKRLSSASKNLNTPHLRQAIKEARKTSRFVTRLNFGSEQVIVKKSGHHITSLFHMTHQKELGAGKYGNVFSVPAITQMETGIFITRVAIKQIRTDYLPDPSKQITPLDCENNIAISKQSIKKGFDNLSKLNANGPQRGVMCKPHAYIENDLYVMDQALCSLNDFNTDHPHFDKFDFDSIFTDLLEGIRFFTKVGFIHNDIKSANILLFLEDGKIVARHADTDGGFFSEELTPTNYLGARSTFPLHDMLLLVNSVRNREDGSPKEIDIPYVMNIHMKQMVYCLGKTMQKLAKTLHVTKHDELINRMVDLDIHKRPSIDEIHIGQGDLEDDEDL